MLSTSRTSLIRAQARRQQRWKDCGGERNQSMACHCGALQARGEAIGRKKDKLQPLSGKKYSFFRSMAPPLEKPQPDHRDMIFRLTDKAHTFVTVTKCGHFYPANSCNPFPRGLQRFSIAQVRLQSYEMQTLSDAHAVPPNEDKFRDFEVYEHRHTYTRACQSVSVFNLASVSSRLGPPNARSRRKTFLTPIRH